MKVRLHQLAPAPGAKRERRRVGRGHGSGRGKTAGRGTKGQNARSGKGPKPFFEGGQNPWTMKVPHRRGFSRGRFRVEPQLVHLYDLERAFQADEVVTLAALHHRGIIDDPSGLRPVKLLADGRLSKRLTIELHGASAGARAAVEQAGGTLRLLARSKTSPAVRSRAGEGAEHAGSESPTTTAER